MQTFLPDTSYITSARILDTQRLGKQRVEAKQILVILLGKPSVGWKNHPAVKMWTGHAQQLAEYGMYICMEWVQRGHIDQQLPFFLQLRQELPRIEESPPWIGNHEFHASHRSNLLRKDKRYYSQFGWTEPDNLPYVWPQP